MKRFLIFLICIGILFSLSVSIVHATTPDQISGLKLWLDASSGVTKDGTTPAVDGDTAQQWNDKSSGGFNATQVASANRPTYKTNIMNGWPVLRFNGSHNMATSSFLDSSFYTSVTFFIVTSKVNTSLEVTTSNQGTTWYTAGQDSTFAARMFGINLTNNYGAPKITQQSFDASITNPQLQTFRYDGASAMLRFNSAARVAATIGNLGLSGALTIGSLSTGAFKYHGDIAEIIMYNTVLNDTQMGQIESYLMSKYNIAAAKPTISTPLFIFDGDSLTYGAGSTGGQDYPAQVQTNLGLAGTYQNVAVSAQTALQMNNYAVYQVDPEFSNLRATNIVSFFGGANDLYYGTDVTTTYNTIVAYCQARRAVGFKVIVNTSLPRSTDSTPATFEAGRQSVNTLIRANWKSFADALSDIASDSRIGNAGDELDTTYYTTDKVHMNNTGYGVVASYVTAAIRQIMNPVITTPLINITTPLTDVGNGVLRLTGNIFLGNRGNDFVQRLEINLNGVGFGEVTNLKGGIDSGSNTSYDFISDFNPKIGNNVDPSVYTILLKATTFVGSLNYLFYFLPFRFSSFNVSNTKLQTFTFSVNKNQSQRVKDNIDHFEVWYKKNTTTGTWTQYISNIPKTQIDQNGVVVAIKTKGTKFIGSYIFKITAMDNWNNKQDSNYLYIAGTAPITLFASYPTFGMSFVAVPSGLPTASPTQLPTSTPYIIS